MTWMELDDLTDNGLEFTDKWARGNGIVSGNHKFYVEFKKIA
jgi:hypothetical protein